MLLASRSSRGPRRHYATTTTINPFSGWGKSWTKSAVARLRPRRSGYCVPVGKDLLLGFPSTESCCTSDLAILPNWESVEFGTAGGATGRTEQHPGILRRQTFSLVDHGRRTPPATRTAYVRVTKTATDSALAAQRLAILLLPLGPARGPGPARKAREPAGPASTRKCWPWTR